MSDKLRPFHEVLAEMTELLANRPDPSVGHEDLWDGDTERDMGEDDRTEDDYQPSSRWGTS